MKKRISLFIATLATLVALPASALAASTSAIAGTVTSNGNPVSGASVSVTCNGHTLTSGTTVAGAYLVRFSPATNCPAGSTAHVTATKGGHSGSKSGTVNNLGADINLAIVNVSNVPEFGMAAGISAAILGGGAFMVVRRRQLSEH